MTRILTLVALALSGTVHVGHAGAQELEVGVRINALHADGDLHGAGLHLRSPLRDGFFVAATLDRYFYDADALPSPLKNSGLTAPQIASTVVGVSVGRLLPIGDHGVDWFWSMGLAAGFPQPVTSPADTGEANAQAGTEIHLRSAIGLERHFAEHWSLSAAVRIEKHYVDARFEDPADGRQGTLSALTPSGLYLALGYRF